MSKLDKLSFASGSRWWLCECQGQWAGADKEREKPLWGVADISGQVFGNVLFTVCFLSDVTHWMEVDKSTVTENKWVGINLKEKKVKVAQSCLTPQPQGLYSLWNSPGQNTGVGSLSLLQEIFPTQGLNPGLLRCMQFLYQLNHKGSPGISLGGDYVLFGAVFHFRSVQYPRVRK